jgi:membrane protein implicated in regulation of membrane protease activity
LTADFTLLWLIVALVAIIASVVVVIPKWKQYSLPIRLIPLDVLTVILLIDLNIKSNNNVTILDPYMKIEAIAFTCLLAFILFAPVLWRVALDRRKRRTRSEVKQPHSRTASPP